MIMKAQFPKEFDELHFMRNFSLKRQKLKVLIIEDNEMVTRTIYELVKAKRTPDIELRDTNQFLAGLELLANENFDAVLLSLPLTDTPYLEALKAIQSNFTGIPIIVLTGKSDEEDAITAIQNGAQDYLIKDRITRDLLIRSILYSIEKKHMLKELQVQKIQFEGAFEAINHSFFSDEVENINSHSWIYSDGRDILERKKFKNWIFRRVDLLNDLSDAVILIDIEFKIRSWNKAAERIYGWKEEEVLGITAEKVFEIDSTRSQLRELFNQLNKEGKWQGEIMQNRKDKTFLNIFSSLSLVTDYWGDPVAVLAVNRDLTGLRYAEESLKLSQEKFRTIFENSHDAIALCNMDGMLVETNQAYLDMLDYDLEEIRSRKFQEVTPKKWEKMEREIVNDQILKQGYSEVYEKEYIRKDGTIIPVEIRGGLLRDEVGKPDQMFAIVRNITDRKKIEEELIQRTLELNERVKELRCLYGVSKATEEQGKPLEKVLQEILVLIPLAWQYPEITTARIIFDGIEYVTDTFQDSPWKQEAFIIVTGQKRGVVEVYYKKEKVGEDEGPFLKEERFLIDRVALEISNFVERSLMKNRLDFEDKNLMRILDSMADGVYIVNSEREIEFVNSSLKTEFGPIDGNTCYRYFHDRNEPCSWCQYDKVKSGETVHREWFSSKNQRAYDIVDSPFRKFEGSISKLGILRDVTGRKKMEEKVRENEEKFRSIFTQVFDALLITDKRGQIIDVNAAASSLLGYEREELIGLFLRDLLSEKEFRKMLSLINKALKGPSTQLGKVTFLRKDGKQVVAEGGGATIEIAGARYFIGSFRDISERIRWEEELRTRIMKFKIEEGNLYLIKERTPTLSLNVLKDLLKVGYKGQVISRTPENDFKKDFDLDLEFLWLSGNGNGERNPQVFEKIEQLLEVKPRRNAILIDRLDYLISNYGFKTTIKFIYKLREITYLSGLVVLLSIDPTTIDEQQLSLLEKETKEITPRFMAKIPENMLEILRYVFKSNNLGMKPSYTDVRDELQISRPTVSKRIKHLLATGYLNEALMGNRKILELSPKGRLLFTL